MQSADKKDAPLEAVLLVRDDNNGILAPPTSFERVDVSGRGLPVSDLQDEGTPEPQYSLLWPIALSEYVALGCVAGNPEAPDEAPSIDSIRCIRADLTKMVTPF